MELKFRAWVYNRYHNLIVRTPAGTGATWEAKWMMGEVQTLYTSVGKARVKTFEDSKLKSSDYVIGDECILMQFTGLYDKNGKEIYEGDIVKYEYQGVEVTDTVERFESFYGVGKYTGALVSFYPIEVIGNIYEK